MHHRSFSHERIINPTMFDRWRLHSLIILILPYDELPSNNTNLPRIADLIPAHALQLMNIAFTSDFAHMIRN